jgi:hypothetical protein
LHLVFVLSVLEIVVELTFVDWEPERSQVEIYEVENIEVI